MEFQEYFPIWDKLNTAQQNKLLGNLIAKTVRKGTVIHNGSMGCTGLLLVKTGQLRAYILSDEGREITLYRLFDRDICLFSASCILRSIQFDVTIETEKDTELWVIPSEVYQSIMAESALLANYTNELMASRFSDVMWTMQQILFMGADRRVAMFLWDEMINAKVSELFITHDEIAKNIGSAREVVTKVLKYFGDEGILAAGRGKVVILDKEKLKKVFM